MDSLDAQCLLIDTIAGEMPPPKLWHHSRTGELSCALTEDGATFTWSVEDVAALARRWRDSAARQVPAEVSPFMYAHRRLDDIRAQAGLEPADAIVHDFDRRELRARWEEQKTVVVVDEISAHASSSEAERPGISGPFVR